jgi:hypothetical protein
MVRDERMLQTNPICNAANACRVEMSGRELCQRGVENCRSGFLCPPLLGAFRFDRAARLAGIFSSEFMLHHAEVLLPDTRSLFVHAA